MNAVSRDYPEEYDICSKEIIEIGAIKLDENYEKIGSFKRFIKPQYNSEIEHIIQHLTGIRYDMVKNEPEFNEVINEFAEWCAKDGDFEIYAWSNCDRVQFMKELTLKQVKLSENLCKMANQWKDFQRIFDIEVHACHSTSLENALKMVGLEFEGRAHDGMVDATNTAKLFAFTKDEKKFRPIADALRDKRKAEIARQEEMAKHQEAEEQGSNE